MLKLLKRLRRCLNGHPPMCVRPSPGLRPPLPEAPAPDDVRGDQVGEWLLLVLGHLRVSERERLQQRVLNNLRLGDAPGAALVNAVQCDGGQRRGQWAMLRIEVGAIDQIELQAREIAHAAGIDDLYGWDWQQQRDRPVRAALFELHTWLLGFGYSLLQMDTGRQEHCLLLSAIGDVEEAMRLGASLGVPLTLPRPGVGTV